MDSTTPAPATSSTSSVIGADPLDDDQVQRPGSSSTTSCNNLTFHQFTDTLLSTQVYFHVLRMKDSFFLWVGASKPVLSHLAMAITSTIAGRHPVDVGTRQKTTAATSVTATTLLGDVSEVTSQNLAARLAKRANKQVLVSYNLPAETGQRDLVALVEKRLCEEMNKHPDKF